MSGGEPSSIKQPNLCATALRAAHRRHIMIKNLYGRWYSTMYLALYRKYRPSGFKDVVGQQPIVTALKNQIATGRVGHAYLFCGTRGTGKTSCAKIFAKAISCKNNEDGDACGVCEICTAEQAGQNIDTQEIDAASNNGVDFIRELREETAFAPTVSRYRVYIIDEVHMLSQAAFNALLKIMEEPPEYVIFMLATTEIHKVPATILSRCQRFDFRRIEPDLIKGRLLHVADCEGIDLSEEAASLISSLADGGMRDALSLLDTVSSGGTDISPERISELAGIADRGYLFDISDMVQAGDNKGLMEKVSQLRSGSLDERQLIKELMNHYKNLMLATIDINLLSTLPELQRRRYENYKDSDMRLLLSQSDILCSALDRIALTGAAESELSLALLKMANDKIAIAQPQAAPPQQIPSPQIQAPQQATIAAQQPVQQFVPPQQPAPQVAPKTASTTATATKPKTPVIATEPEDDNDDIRVMDSWGQVVELLKDINPLAYASLINTTAYIDKTNNRVLIDGNKMFLEFMRKEKENSRIVREAISQITGKSYSIGPYKTADKNSTTEATIKMLEQRGVPIEYK